MNQTVFVFISGLGGVFLGMAMLYISIRLTSFVIGKWVETGEDQ